MRRPSSRTSSSSSAVTHCGRPSKRMRLLSRRGLSSTDVTASPGGVEETLEETRAAAAVGQDVGERVVARRRRQVEPLVLLVAAGQGRAGEVPTETEDADALV